MTTKEVLLTSIFLIIAVAPFSSFAETTLYGSVRAGISWTDQDEGGAFDEVSDLQAIDHGSHFGLRGSEDLGNGLSAIYQYEFGADVENNSNASTRDSFVGLGGSFGTIRVGRGQTPFYNVAARTDVFNSMTGDFRSILGADVTGLNSFNQRVDNAITYQTSNFNNFLFNIAYVTESNPGNNLEENDDSILSLSGEYSVSGFNIIGAYQTYSAPVIILSHPDSV